MAVLKNLGPIFKESLIVTGIVLLLVVAVTVASAKWYNPLTWFGSDGPPATHQQMDASSQRQEPALQSNAYAMVETPSAKQNESHGVAIVTSKGTMIAELFYKDAPKTVANFKSLIDQDFYGSGDMVFHRVVDNFVIQTGDPTGTGFGGSSKTIPLEISDRLIHSGKGILSMARSSDPNSASSQFYVTKKRLPFLDGKYAVFGRVIQGLEVIDRIEQGDMLLDVKPVSLDDVKVDKNAPKLDGFSYRMRRMFTLQKADS